MVSVAFKGGFPASLRFISGDSRILLRGGRGSEQKHQVEFARSQNWIGGSSPGKCLRLFPPSIGESDSSRRKWRLWDATFSFNQAARGARLEICRGTPLGMP